VQFFYLFLAISTQFTLKMCAEDENHQKIC